MSNSLMGIAALLIEHSLMPCAPFFPTVAVTMQVLELFCTSHLCCPHLSIQSFVKGLSNLHNVPHEQQLSQHFMICYDLYLQICEEVQQHVHAALDCDTTDWRLCNACPACTYKLDGEEALVFDMLVTMDGNDSLKWILQRREAAPRPVSVEAPNPCKVHSSYYLTHDQVNSDITSQMWGIFEETRIFLVLCHHGFVLVVADMICSSELAKYPLAVVESLLNAFSGSQIGGGYDIGCQFQVMLSHSGLKDHILEDHYILLIGLFHSHAHNHLCQLSFLATYVKGMGLESLEGCK
ncbi:hypothetical protein P691DRAFT_794215 [Macrolepiota fuliginosa MF-IS2]|uniref:Uncharacterized protein n=1 Tax=Macrolepiota fuliginosa MF-IS2 TaxID=1400762 RepID=A0A9P6BW57_9AGAR|nr:hypothetical protein P691DRAFT_794215 [Macrolepiota fuliginosa MF-IS2]